MEYNFKNEIYPMTPLWILKNTRKNNYLFMTKIWKGFLIFSEVKVVAKNFVVSYVAVVEERT